MYAFKKRITFGVMGRSSEDDIKETNKIKKENKKYRKEIEKYLKKTLDHWDYYWDGCGYIAYLKNGKETLVSYDYESRSFDFRTLDAELILEALYEKIKNENREVVVENIKLARLLGYIKNFFVL